MNSYRRSTLRVCVIVLLVAVVGFIAAAAQRRKPHKLRATALLEFPREGSADKPRLVPITILDDSSFHDASIYKATPEPMALGDGVVYEAQKAGLVVGYFTVGKATKGPIWTAMGRWAVVSNTPKSQASSSAASNAAVDERPTLRRPGASPSSSPGAATSAPSTPSQQTSSPSDDRPVLHRPSGDTSTASSPTPGVSASPTPTPAASEPDSDPNRPTLRHRKTGEEEVQSKSAPSTPTPARTPVATPKSSVPAPAVPLRGQSLVAVSDAQPSESRSYDFIWKAGEKETVDAKMRTMALAQLPHDNSAPMAAKSLSNVVIRGFDLDLSNEAVVVLSAEVAQSRTPPAAKLAGKSATKGAAGGKESSASAPGLSPSSAPATRYLTLIARLDFDGNPQKLAASVTDSSRLDVAPRLELIDAVDVDGDGLAELLFREYSFDDKSFVVFSIGRTTVTKLFEGASQPLK